MGGWVTGRDGMEGRNLGVDPKNIQERQLHSKLSKPMYKHKARTDKGVGPIQTLHHIKYQGRKKKMKKQKKIV